MSFSEEIPTERILNFVAIGDQELGTSEMQGPRKWNSIKTFQMLPKIGVGGVGKKCDFRGLVQSNGDEFVLQVSNDGLYQNRHKPGIMLEQTVSHGSSMLDFTLYTDPDHERRTFSILASRAMAYSKFVHPLGKSSGYGR